MLREQRFFAIGISVLGAVLFGCGSPRAAEAPAAEPAPSAEAAPAEPSKKPRSIEDEREGFMKSCEQGAGSVEYCNCGFEQFKEVFKDADLSKPLDPKDPRLGELQKKTAAACASKLTEEDLKARFVSACTAGDDARQPYCTCRWDKFRKQYSAVQIFDGTADPRAVKGLDTCK